MGWAGGNAGKEDGVDPEVVISDNKGYLRNNLVYRCNFGKTGRGVYQGFKIRSVSTVKCVYDVRSV